MENMDALHNHPSNDPTIPSPYTPLLDLEAAASNRQQHDNHRRPKVATLLLVAGLLGIILCAVVATFSSNNDNVGGRLPAKDEGGSVMTSTDPGVAAGVSKKSDFRPSLGAGKHSYSWTNELLAWQRTTYHFQPEKNWMNDPNAPVLYNGWYHFFYQYNPFGAVWGNIVWGHAVSKDLIHWQHLPIAMVPDHWYDIDGVWTGSATILEDGQLIVLYTGSTNESVQVQNLAYPSNSSDPFLLEWVKYEGNPVLVPPHGIHHRDFRDPTTAWRTSDGKKWRFTIGSKVNKTGISLVYETEDFKSYNMLDMVLHAVPGTGMWECVDFYPISTTKDEGLDTSYNGSDVKHVMKTSLDDDRRDYYTIGGYDSHTGEWTPDDPIIDVGIGLRYDYGSFYASKTFYDQGKKRRILWGWITEMDSVEADIKKGWASLQAIPRTILFDRKTENNILQWPVEEVERLRQNEKVFHKVEAKPGAVVPLDISPASELDIVAEFDIDKDTLRRANYQEKMSFNCSTSHGAVQRGALGPFGLLVLTDKDQNEQTPIYFYVYKDNQGDFQTFFCSDHTRSSIAEDVEKAVHGTKVTVLKGEKLTMRILIDHSIVESFAQGGRACITSRIYPTKAVYNEARVFVFNNATDVQVTASVRAWQMADTAPPSRAVVACSVPLMAVLLPVVVVLFLYQQVDDKKWFRV